MITKKKLWKAFCQTKLAYEGINVQLEYARTRVQWLEEEGKTGTEDYKVATTLLRFLTYWVNELEKAVSEIK